MLNFIRGKVAGSYGNVIIIENNGIGFEVHMPSSSAAFMAAENTEITVYTAMIVREDDISLYGFDDRESQQMFFLLTGVSGIGSKGALAILSALTVQEIRRAIAFEDAGMLSKAQGVGKKTAQRIVLELKDKIDPSTLSQETEITESSGRGTASSGAAEAIEALVSLGYSKTEAADAVAASGLKDGSAEEYIRIALKRLSIF